MEIERQNNKTVRNTAFAFIILMGVVSLFSDITHEGASSIIGAYLSLAGASASTIGFVSGLGVFVGYSLRLLTGFLSDKTKKYWLITIIGYVIDVFGVPLLALVPQGGWKIACAIIIIQKMGKALKKPAKNTMISFAASQCGQGKGFAIGEFIDQLGAFLGPFFLFLVLLLKKGGDTFSSYSFGFALLGIPAVVTVVLLLFARKKYPHPEEFENSTESGKNFKLKRSFVFYLGAISLVAFGCIDFPLITLHTVNKAYLTDEALPLVYSGAMAVDAFAALFFGRMYDKFGIKALILSTVLAAPFSVLVFLGGNIYLLFAGVALWGIGMGAQESILKAAVSEIVSKEKRSTGFGIFETVFGVFWFLGSWLTGFLYDVNIIWLVVVSVSAELLALPMFYMTSIFAKKEKTAA